MKLLGLGLAVLIVAVVRPAGACGVSPRTSVLRGAPAAEQAGVPTDVVPVYNLNELGSSDWARTDFSLRSAAGEAVGVTKEEVAAGHVALRPAALLQPNTRYVLRATYSYYDDGEPQIDQSLSFTTGAGPLPAGELPEPVAAAQQYWFSHNGANSAACDFWSQGACVSIPQGELVEVRYLLPDGERSGAYLHDGPFETDVQEQVIDGEVCLELRRRALNGALSEPTTTCGSELPRVDLIADAAPSCIETGAIALYGDYTTREPGEEFTTTARRGTLEQATAFPNANPSADGGCALARRAAGGSGASVPLAAVALGVLLRRRRR